MTYRESDSLTAMLHRLTNWWWSTEPPHHYKKVIGDSELGLGVLAYNNPGLFNLAWACGWEDKATNPACIPEMRVRLAGGNELLKHRFLGETYADWFTMASPELIAKNLEQNEMNLVDVEVYKVVCKAVERRGFSGL